MSSRPPPQDTYARLLSSSRGYPLWTPEPSNELLMQRQEGLAIGDVGVVLEHGGVDVLFNLCLPADHPFHLRHGVPRGFTCINQGRLDIMTITNAEPPSYVIHSSSVTPAKTLGSSDGVSETHGPNALPYRFHLSTSEGAALVLPRGAERYDLLNEELFLEQARQYGAAWYDYAVNRRGRRINPDSLYLITGAHKTLAWSAAVFESASPNEHHTAYLRQIERNDYPPIYTWEAAGPYSLEWRVAPDIGPHVDHSIPNQAVFIRGFKIAIRNGLLGIGWVSVEADSPSTRPKNVKWVPSDSFILRRFAGFLDVFSSSGSSSFPRTEGTMNAGEERLQSDTHRDGYDGTQVKIQRILDVPRSFHPSDAINRYLLEQDSSANIAITHDSHWISLLEDNVLTQGELMDGSSVETVLSHNYRVVSRDGAVYLERKSSQPAASRPQSTLEQAAASAIGTQSSPSRPHLSSDDLDPSISGDNKRVGMPLAHPNCTPNIPRGTGFFGSEEVIPAMATVPLYTGRRWLGWYNSPGSYTIDREQGPKYTAVFSDATMQTGHLGYLTMERSKDMQPRDIVGRGTRSFCVSYLAMKNVDYKIPVEPLPLKDALFAIIPITFSVMACVLSALIYDWYCFDAILLGIVTSGLASYVIGEKRLVLKSVSKPSKGSPPGHGVLIGDNEVVVIKGREGDVNAITNGYFDFETNLQQGDKNKSAIRQRNDHTLKHYFALLSFQSLLQLLLVSRASLFGQIMFLSSLVVSAVYDSYLYSRDKRTNILFKKLDNPQMLRFRTGTKTTMAVFICLLLFHGVDVSEEDKRSLRIKVLRSCLPNDTVLWARWMDKVVEQLLHLPESRPVSFPHLEEDDADKALQEPERMLLRHLLEDAESAINGYYAFRMELPNDSTH